MELGEFYTEVESFAAQTDRLLQAVFDDAPATSLLHRDGEARSVAKANVPLYASGCERVLARLRVDYRFCRDSRQTYLAVEESKFVLVAEVDRTPIIRFEYDREHHASKPGAHIQVHAHRGALSHLLSQTGHGSPHSMESLHLPVGGDRFRLCLEDVVEFVVLECGFAGRDNWRTAVRNGRIEWRRNQLRATIRDLPETAADALRRLGYAVVAPEDAPADRCEKINAW
ncbi:hypothetical protein [Nocardia cyriacigeorgica]|uniref:hypothetical protein n=1 Tax=Nocardia cyriacigeorgica TaxID=135487 RepID=UPI00245393B7|nr:hypothetical protein [Nocardia cyriacigeorgica]